MGQGVFLHVPPEPRRLEGGTGVVNGIVEELGEVGTVTAREPGDNWEIVRIAVPAGLDRYIVEKGSITVDGISLTVVDDLPGEFSVSLIPITLELTTLGRKQAGDPVNLEVDVLAKYAEKLLGAGR